MPTRDNASSDLSGFTSGNPVYDIDNVYLSDQGWAYRHYKDETGTEYWDEVIVAGEVPAGDSPDPFGAASPTFEIGDGSQAERFTIGPSWIGGPDYTHVDGDKYNVNELLAVTVAVNSEDYPDITAIDNITWTSSNALAIADIATAGNTRTVQFTTSATPGDHWVEVQFTDADAKDSPHTVRFNYTTA